MSRRPVEIDPKEALQKNLEHLKLMLENRIEEAGNTSHPILTPPPLLSERGAAAATPAPSTPPKKPLSALENLLKQTDELLTHIENGEAFATAGKAFGGIISKLKNQDVQEKAQNLLDPIDQHATKLKHPTHILRDKRKAKSEADQIKVFQDAINPTLKAIEKRAQETEQALYNLALVDYVPPNPTYLQYFRSLLFEYRTRIPQEERMKAAMTAQDIRHAIQRIQNNVNDLKDPADAMAIIASLNTTCEQFTEHYATHKRSIDRIAFGEALFAPLVAVVNFVEKHWDSFESDEFEPYETTHVKQSHIKNTAGVVGLNQAFVEWRTKEAPYQKEERETNTKLLQINLLQMKNTSGNAPWSHILSVHAGLLNEALKNQRTYIHHHPLETRLIQFEFLASVQYKLDRLIEARADDDFEACYKHASSLMESLSDAKERAESKADQKVLASIETITNEMLYAIDTSSEGSGYPTEIEQEQTLRKNVQSNIDNTDVIIQRLRKMGHPESYPLITEAKTFINAAKLWQSERRGALPETRQESNDKFIQAYTRFDGWLEKNQAKKVIKQNKVLEKAYNALVGGMNLFIRQISPGSQFETYSRKKTMADIKANMRTLKSTQKENEPAINVPPEDQNAFEKQRDICRAYIKNTTAKLNRTLADAQANIDLGASPKKYQDIIGEARAQRVGIEELERCFRTIENVDSTNSGEFLAAGSTFANDMVKARNLSSMVHNKQGNLVISQDTVEQAARLLLTIDAHSKHLEQPTRITEGRQFEKAMHAINFQIDKQVIRAEGIRKGWFTKKATKEQANTTIYDLGTLKLAAQAFQASHKEAKVGHAWVPDEDNLAFKTLTKAIAVFSARYENPNNPLIQDLHAFVKAYTPSQQATMKATLQQDDGHEQTPPNTPPPSVYD
jgi:hypothetical protein